MEEREILIANTKTQKRSKITTSATTLGELKVAMTEAGIDFSGMTFTEGISKTQLLDNATQLPHNVMYKGQPTNNLVILLTNTKKNIASGVNRKEAYELIKTYGLAEGIKKEFNTNYTHVSTDNLWSYIDSHVKDPIDDCLKTGKEEVMQEAKEVMPDAEAIGKSIFDHVGYLVNAGVFDITIVRHLASSFNIMADELEEQETPSLPSESVSTSDGRITENDVDGMINDLV